VGAVVQVFRIIIDTRGRGIPSFPAHCGIVWRVLSQIVLTGSIPVVGRYNSGELKEPYCDQ